jgi:hypothetical protein
MQELLSACGLLCNECKFLGDTCDGCYAVKGKTFWAKEFRTDKICPLFNCAVNDKKFNNCGQCDRLPCKAFTELQDPEISDEEHAKSIELRISRLR